MGLRPGDQIALRDALYSALLGSDNVAAQTIAASYPREEACTLLQEVRAHEADPAMATFLDDLLMENCR